MSKLPSKPTAPRAPIEPKVPTKVIDEVWPFSITIYDNTLSEIVSQVAKQVTRSRDMRLDCVFIDPTMDDIKVEQVYDYGDDSHIEAKWSQAVQITLSDAQFAAAQGKHRKAMLEYNGRLKDYQSKVKQYDKDLLAYEAAKARAIEAREQAEMARLMTKYSVKDSL